MPRTLDAYYPPAVFLLGVRVFLFFTWEEKLFSKVQKLFFPEEVQKRISVLLRTCECAASSSGQLGSFKFRPIDRGSLQLSVTASSVPCIL